MKRRIRRAREPGFLNPKQPQGAKRIEMAGKVFNPKQLQRGKRIEREEEALNPKWFQKAKWIERADQAGAGACLSSK